MPELGAMWTADHLLWQERFWPDLWGYGGH
jgi:hypothetical protein